MISRHSHRAISGFTLVELLITMAVLAVISAIAIPAYLGYVEEGRMSAARGNVEPLRLALEDFFLENGTYAIGEWKADGSVETLEANIGWHPDGDGEAYDYKVVAGTTDPVTGASDCAGITSCYTLTVESTQDTNATVTCSRNQSQGTFVCR